jgi:hypothetical protein
MSNNLLFHERPKTKTNNKKDKNNNVAWKILRKFSKS